MTGRPLSTSSRVSSVTRRVTPASGHDDIHLPWSRHGTDRSLGLPDGTSPGQPLNRMSCRPLAPPPTAHRQPPPTASRPPPAARGPPRPPPDRPEALRAWPPRHVAAWPCRCPPCGNAGSGWAGAESVGCVRCGDHSDIRLPGTRVEKQRHAVLPHRVLSWAGPNRMFWRPHESASRTRPRGAREREPHKTARRTRARAAQDREAHESASRTRPRGALSRLPTGRLPAGRPPTGPADADRPAAPRGLLPGTGRRKGLAQRAPRHRPVPHESLAAARTSTCAGSVGHTGLSRAPGRGGALELEVGAVAERTTTVHRQPRIMARAAPGSAR